MGCNGFSQPTGKSKGINRGWEKQTLAAWQSPGLLMKQRTPGHSPEHIKEEGCQVGTPR